MQRRHVVTQSGTYMGMAMQRPRGHKATSARSPLPTLARNMHMYMSHVAGISRQVTPPGHTCHLWQDAHSAQVAVCPLLKAARDAVIHCVRPARETRTSFLWHKLHTVTRGELWCARVVDDSHADACCHVRHAPAPPTCALPPGSGLKANCFPNRWEGAPRTPRWARGSACGCAH